MLSAKELEQLIMEGEQSRGKYVNAHEKLRDFVARYSGGRVKIRDIELQTQVNVSTLYRWLESRPQLLALTIDGLVLRKIRGRIKQSRTKPSKKPTKKERLFNMPSNF